MTARSCGIRLDPFGVLEMPALVFQAPFGLHRKASANIYGPIGVRQGPSGNLERLSNVLADRASQDLASALKLYADPGKIWFYCRMLDSMEAASTTKVN